MTGSGEGFHAPVMVAEVMEALEPRNRGLYLDGTVGGGGHARAILDRCAGCRVVGVDRDPEALEEARTVLARFDARVRLVRAGFDEALEVAGLPDGSLAGALLDLGVSSHQLDEDGRGFAFRPGAPLDMRMAGEAEERPTAAELLNEATEGELRRIFREYGEERRAGRLASAVARRRRRAPLRTSDDLVAALATALDRAPSPRDKARIFQAVRIAVNDEMGALERALPSLREGLAPGGVLAVIAYHSLEDRAVKHAFRDWSKECVCPPELPVCRCRGRALGRVVEGSPRRPSEAEVARNPRARSARLRAWRKAA